jgi:hypothetical protein
MIETFLTLTVSGGATLAYRVELEEAPGLQKKTKDPELPEKSFC